MEAKPWNCPRCRAWHSPASLKCDCKPIKREYCEECLGDAIKCFRLSLPSNEIIEMWAEYFHKNFKHREENEATAPLPD